jgi:hypothetical protein
MCDQNAAPSLTIGTFGEADVDTKKTPMPRRFSRLTRNEIRRNSGMSEKVRFC